VLFFGVGDMRKLQNHIALFLLIVSSGFYSAASVAEDYYWSMLGGKYSSISSACNAYLMANQELAPSTNFSLRIDKVNDTNYRCVLLLGSGATYSSQITSRYGDGCTDPATYNSQTGECEAPQEPENSCQDKVGQDEPFSKTGSRGDGFYDTVNVGGKNMGVTPDVACLGGCTAFLNQSCVFTISANRYSCSGRAFFTGEQCTAGPTSVDSSPTVREEEPEVTNNEEPCIYVQDAEGRSHCMSSKEVEQQGQNCGTAGPAGSEQVKCFPKEAKRDETKIQTEVTETPEADGGKTTVKTDVHTETKCTGNNDNCTTTTTTTTTTTKTDGSGTTTKVEVSCKGAKCGEDGKGGGGGGGGGSGSGDGDDQEGGGDLPGNDDVPGFGESLSSFYSRAGNSPVFAAVQGIAMPSGGSCNFGSATIPVIGSISFNWVCQNADLFDPLYYVMLAIWALAAVRVFLEA